MAKKLDSYSVMGLRKHQEDRLIAVRSKGLRGSLLGVFDGHGGSEVSDRASRIVGGLFVNALKRFPRNYMDALKAVMTSLQETFAKTVSVGSSCSLVYIPATAKFAYVAVLGDSPVVVLTRVSEFWVGPVHNSDNPDEVARLKLRNAIFENPYFYNRSGRGLALSRSLGDGDMPFLVRQAEFAKVPLGKRSAVLVGSDGLFARRSYQAAFKSFGLNLKANYSAEEFVTCAYHNGSHDNLTAVVWRA